MGAAQSLAVIRAIILENCLDALGIFPERCRHKTRVSHAALWQRGAGCIGGICA